MVMIRKPTLGSRHHKQLLVFLFLHLVFCEKCLRDLDHLEITLGSLHHKQLSGGCGESRPNLQTGLSCIMMIMKRMMMMTAYRHIPTMTNSHHGGFLSVMIMVGICQ